MNQQQSWAIRPEVPEELYTDRQEYLDYFYEAALETIPRRTMSTVLLGQRRMGKTEIFKRAVNRLFFEQDHRDPQAVVPVYFAFPDEKLDRWDFALRYVDNFARWYAAFRLKDLNLLYEQSVPRDQLVETIKSKLTVTQGLQGVLNMLHWLPKREGVTIPEEVALATPKFLSQWDDSNVVMFLDEFQNTRLPHYDFSVVGWFQQVVESNTCPHFVTGSAMSILTEEILGRGALYGRFMSKPIEAMTDYWGSELAQRAARYYQAELPEVMAPVVADRCGGNPFYITAVIRQTAQQKRALADEETLNEMLAVDISSGFIWAELHDQVTRWIRRINEYGVTKWVLYLAARQEGEEISLEQIQRELWEQDQRDVDLNTIRETLVKLSRGDLIDYKSFGGWFSQVNDPILVDFLKVWGRTEVLREYRREVGDELRTKYRALHKHIADYKGYLAEVFMIQVLWNSQNTTLPGKWLHSAADIPVPRFSYIDQRSRLGAGKGLEIDIFGAAGVDVWIAESKWWSGKPVGIEVVKHLLAQAAIVRERRSDNLETLRLWLFAHDGFTRDAEALMREQSILWSDRDDLNALLEYVHLRPLPAIEAAEGNC